MFYGSQFAHVSQCGEEDSYHFISFKKYNAPKHLRSPIIQLLHGIYQNYPLKAQWISRARILHSKPLSPAEWGTLKVLGKRAKEIVHTRREVGDQRSRQSYVDCIRYAKVLTHKELRSCPVIPVKKRPFSSVTEVVQWLDQKRKQKNDALGREGQQEQSFPYRRWSGARRVVTALLLDSNLVPLYLAHNQPQISAGWHAEYCILDALLRTRVEESEDAETLIMISTLKPCKMCAGLWWNYAPCKQLKIYYIEDDLGRSGQNTVFDHASFAWNNAQKWAKKYGRLIGSTQQKIPLE